MKKSNKEANSKKKDSCYGKQKKLNTERKEENRTIDENNQNE